MCGTWHVHMCDMTWPILCAWHDSSICVTWLLYLCDERDANTLLPPPGHAHTLSDSRTHFAKIFCTLSLTYTLSQDILHSPRGSDVLVQPRLTRESLFKIRHSSFEMRDSSFEIRDSWCEMTNLLSSFGLGDCCPIFFRHCFPIFFRYCCPIFFRQTGQQSPSRNHERRRVWMTTEDGTAVLKRYANKDSSFRMTSTNEEVQMTKEDETAILKSYAKWVSSFDMRSPVFWNEESSQNASFGLLISMSLVFWNEESLLISFEIRTPNDERNQDSIAQKLCKPRLVIWNYDSKWGCSNDEIQMTSLLLRIRSLLFFL